MTTPYRLKGCQVCGGTLGPHSLCSHCGAARHGEAEVTGRLWKCPACEKNNPIQFICRNCGTRFLYEEVVPEGPAGAIPHGPEVLRPPEKLEPKRQLRRLKGDYDEKDIAEVSRIPSVGREKAEALCKAGYNAIWKLKRAAADELSAVPGVGAEVAKAIKDATNPILILPAQRSREDILTEERACRRCGLPTSLFSRACLECGGEFEEEEMDEAIREELNEEGNGSVVEFYGHAVSRRLNDSLLWFALALCLSQMRRPGAAKKALDRAKSIEPTNNRFLPLENRLEEEALKVFEVRREKPTVPPEKPARTSEAKAPQKPSAEPVAQADVQPAAVVKTETGGEEIKKLDELKLIAEAHHEIDEALGEEEPEEAAPEQPEPKPVEPEAPMPEKQLPEPPESTASRAEEPAKEQPKGEVVLPRPRARALKVTLPPSRRPLLSGHGLVNGRGRVNGLINGNGFINGGSISRVSLPRSNNTQRYVVVATVLVAIFLTVNTVFQSQVMPGEPIKIDGDFGDWAGVGAYSDSIPAANPDVNLTGYALRLDDMSLFFMAQVQGSLFNDTRGYDALYLFLDTDANNATGYWCGSIGADYMVTVEGTNGTAVSSSFSSFGGLDRLDWNAWVNEGGVRVASSGRRIEGAIEVTRMVLTNANHLLAKFVMDDEDGNASESSIAIGPDYGALKVTQKSLTNVLQAGPTSFLELTFELTGKPLTLEANDFIISHSPGTQISGLPPRLQLASGTPHSVTVGIDASSIPTGDAVNASLASVTADRPVTIIGSGAIAYSVSPPASKRIDGLFADWPSPHADSDTVPMKDPSLDVTCFDGNVMGTKAFFYFRTADLAFEGTNAPMSKIKLYSPSGGGGGTPRPPPRLTGEDIARAYLDSEPSVTDGYAIGGMRAKYMIEARGSHGSVLSVSTYSWQNRWVLFAGSPEMANVDREAEMSMTLPSINSQNATYLIETSDWRGRGDVTVIAGTRSSDSTRTRGMNLIVMGTYTLLNASYTNNPPSIDGEWTTGEWSDADSFDTGTMVIYTMQDGAHLFVCIRVTSDTTYEAGDYAEIAFDTDYDGDTAPDQYDKKFSATDPDGSTVNVSYNGKGGVWDPGYVASPWEANGTLDTDGSITYEFKIPFVEVWNTSNPGLGQIAGMAVHAHNANGGGSDYYWGSTNLNDPSTFGILDIPEFQDILLVVLFAPAVVLVLRRAGKINKRRRH